MIPQISPIQFVADPLFEEKSLAVYIKRDDMIHPYIMGNKWRKLKYNLDHILRNNLKGIVTFGGAFSNHISATAALCQENELKCTGIIRGDELNPQSNPTLRFASSKGMDLKFVSRKEYRLLKEDPQQLTTDFPGYFILPEGGTNQLAIKGCQEIIEELPESFDYIVVSVGTGGTMAGLLKGLQGKGIVIGFAALKGDFVSADFKELIGKNKINFTNYQIISDFHFGGYGRVNDELIRFINRTKETIGLLFDPIYTAKMYFGVRELAKNGFFDPGSKLLLIHTGGLQGIAGYNENHKKKIMI